MLELMLNPLSPANQCASDDAAKSVIRNVLDCLDHIDLLLVNRRGIVYFDERLEERSLGPIDSYGVAIAKLVNTRDGQLARKWYLYRRRLSRVEPPDCHVVMASGDGSCNESVSGDVSQNVFIRGLASVSFGGGPLTESKSLTISSNIAKGEIVNHHCVASLKASLPFYRASPKHRLKKYFDLQRGEWVAPMTLPEDLAQQVLSLGVRHESDYFGYHAPSEKILRFKQTLGNEYHGFEIELTELPNEIVAQVIPAR